MQSFFLIVDKRKFQRFIKKEELSAVSLGKPVSSTSTQNYDRALESPWLTQCSFMLLSFSGNFHSEIMKKLRELTPNL